MKVLNTKNHSVIALIKTKPHRVPDNVRYDISPGRDVEVMVNMSRSKAVEILNVADGTSKREIRMRYMALVRKYHPDKWCSRCKFSIVEGENVFKNISNVYDILK